ncbi:TIGR00730 family Rossman fold protein [Mesonia sp.]|uniref:LOG family protein n=1 Tax=Mesonia sp. TaxID=1960830 RepID=UPI003F976E13
MSTTKHSDSKNDINSIAVFCGSGDSNDEYIYNQAYEMGRALGNKNIDVVFGGSKLGLMGQVANGALDNDGLVYGVIPEFLKTKEIVHRDLTELITTQDMHERKLKMHEMSDGFIMLPGGFGTLEEFFEIVTWGQLGLHKKPIGILNTEGYYNDLLMMFNNMVTKGLLKKENLDLIVVSDAVEVLLDKMEKYESTHEAKWMNEEDQT